MSFPKNLEEMIAKRDRLRKVIQEVATAQDKVYRLKAQKNALLKKSKDVSDILVSIDDMVAYVASLKAERKELQKLPPISLRYRGTVVTGNGEVYSTKVFTTLFKCLKARNAMVAAFVRSGALTRGSEQAIQLREGDMQTSVSRRTIKNGQKP